MAIDYTYYTLKDPIFKNVSCIYRLPDGAIIPLDNNNGDYRNYLDWVAEGNIAPNINDITNTPSE